MNHLSTLRLHQLRLGELHGPARDAAEAHLDACSVCSARLGHQDATRQAFVARPVPAAITALDAPSWLDRLRSFRLGLLIVPLAAAALVTFSLPEDGIRTKGEPAERAKGVVPVLEAWVRSGGSARPVYRGESMRAGTQIQLKYDAGAHRFVTIAGRDAKGTVEIYQTVPASAGLTAAPFALTLDDAPGDQAFFAVLTDTRPDPDAVVEALSSDPVRMDAGEIASLVLRKE
jgi:hypothetical protein